MKVPSHNTELNNRVLWYDGDSSMDESQIISSITKGHNVNGLFVDKITPNIKQYNALVSNSDKIIIKEEVKPLDTSWSKLPPEYDNLNISQYVTDLLITHCEQKGYIDDKGNLSDSGKLRVHRVTTELSLFKNQNLESVLKTIIYIINTLSEKNLVWGVGRGSSVSSYVLFLIGAHDVDSVEYGLDIEDFLHS